MRSLRITTVIFVALGFIQIYGCGFQNKKNNSVSNQKKQECIDYVIAQDDSLGRIRNQASETVSLSESIEQYVTAVNNLDFEDCPSEFTRAFKKHLNAWTEMKSVTDNYPVLRGEMHLLFETLAEGEDKEKFESSLEKIRDTWKEVEKAHQSAYE